MKRFLLVILWFGITVGCMAQIDTEFWFAAPDLEANHAQQPIRFCVVSYESATTVVFEQPANAFYDPQTFHLEANDCYVYDVSNIIGIVETQPYNTVLDYGFYIHSDAPVSIYYESDNNNSEIYSLKGRNALGTSFVVPMQYTFENYYSSTCSRIEVVASQDDTQVVFYPSVAIKGGGLPGVPVTVSLNRGQSYAIEAASPQGSAHLRNTRITSTKPIAVNSSDDSVNLGGHYDLVGDQIVPVDLLGTDYIAIWNNNPDEYLYFFPTDDNTHIYLNGNSVPVATLDVGQEYMFQITSAVMYIHADKPISVFQLSSSSMNEFGGTVLPQISCTGSLKTVYKRQSTSNLVVTLIVRTPYIDGFVLNGNSTCITANDFTAVPANPDYSYCKKNVSNYVPTNGLMSLENIYADGYFHLGILTGIEGDTWNYGYFSDYQPYAFAEFQMDDTYCSGQDIEFVYSTENVSNLVLVLPNGEEEQLPFVLNNARPEQSGLYSLRGEDCNGVRILDEIDIAINSAGEVTVSLEGCNNVEWHGHTFTHSVDTIWMMPSQNPDDCDSIYMLHLTVYPPNDTTIVDAGICIGQSYNFHGELFNHDGDVAYFDTLDNHGCLKVEKLVLSVDEYQMPPIENRYVCVPHGETPYFMWDKNGVAYHADTYDEAIVPDPEGGCDFKYRLNLRFHQEYYEEVPPVIACDSYYWPVTGVTYSELGNHVITKTFQHGFGDVECDSTYVLNLTINESSTQETHNYDGECDTIAFPWFGEMLYFTNDCDTTLSGQTPDGCLYEVNLHVANMQYTPTPYIAYVEDDYYQDGDTLAVITNTEFFSFQYDFYVADERGHFDDWDSCVWHIDKESWKIDTAPAAYQDITDRRYCKVYVAEHSDSPVELKCTIYNSHCEPYSIERRFYLKSSFFGIGEQDAEKCAFDIIPNPNDGTMELRFEHMEGKVEVKVYDVMGSLVDSFVTSNDMDSNTMEYNLRVRSGVYFFVANGKEGTIAKKVIIR